MPGEEQVTEQADEKDEFAGQDCPRCGSLLPEADEGLCQTCGFEFGRATLYMPAFKAGADPGDALVQGALDAMGSSPGPSTVEVEPEPFPTPVAQSAPPEDNKLVFILVGIVVLLVVVIGLFLAIWFGGG